MAVTVGADCLYPRAPADVIDGDNGVGALVGIGADHDHVGGTPDVERAGSRPKAARSGHASIQLSSRLL